MGAANTRAGVIVSSVVTRSRWLRFAGLGVLAATVTGWLLWREPDYRRIPIRSFEDLEFELAALRARLSIPGLSAAIAEGDRIVWGRGFGTANRERAIPAEPETIYPLASLTKPYAATVLLQLAEQGRLSLDDPVSRFGIVIERTVPVTIRHLLSHTSGEPPGTTYRYDGNAFGSLTQVVERVTGHPFAKALTDRIIRPLALARTAPYPGDPQEFWSLIASVHVTAADVERSRASFAATGIDRGPIDAALAQGYTRAWGRSLWPSGLLGPMRPIAHGFTLSATAGLVASAPDVARFSIALDQGRLLNEATQAEAWRRPVAPDGTRLPYALGWFVQDVAGQQVVWHYGHALESSSLIVKIPAHRVTFVILANSDALSRWRRLGDRADVTASSAALLFLNWYRARPNGTPRAAARVTSVAPCSTPPGDHGGLKTSVPLPAVAHPATRRPSAARRAEIDRSPRRSARPRPRR
jgi:CubicO group peptidase (beta-lactamase class C family)